MNIETVVVGPIRTNCYLVEDAGRIVVVDPGDEPERIMDALDRRPVDGIWVTHRHWDHVNALAALEERTRAFASMPAADADAVDGKAVLDGRDIAHGHAPARIERRLEDGDVLQAGDARFEVIATPGHTPGSSCFYCASEGVLLAGDTLFQGGSYGRTDLEGGSFEAIVASMSRLAALPDVTVILPGHGPRTTMAAERVLNPYLGK